MTHLVCPRVPRRFTPARTAQCRPSLGNTVATVAHPEVTTEMLEEWLTIYGYDIEPPSPSVQPIERIRERLAERCATMHRLFTDRLYDAWFARVRTHSLGDVIA